MYVGANLLAGSIFVSGAQVNYLIIWLMSQSFSFPPLYVLLLEYEVSHVVQALIALDAILHKA